MTSPKNTTRVDQRRLRSHPHEPKRGGAAVMEFALILPVLFLIVFGSIQACNVVFLQQYITEVGYQGALYASRAEATEAEIEDDISAMLTARGITTAVVEVSGVSGQSFDTLASGQNYRVRIQVTPNALNVGPSVTNYYQLSTESFGRRP